MIRYAPMCPPAAVFTLRRRGRRHSCWSRVRPASSEALGSAGLHLQFCGQHQRARASGGLGTDHAAMGDRLCHMKPTSPAPFESGGNTAQVTAFPWVLTCRGRSRLTLDHSPKIARGITSLNERGGPNHVRSRNDTPREWLSLHLRGRSVIPARLIRQSCSDGNVRHQLSHVPDPDTGALSGGKRKRSMGCCS